MMDRSFVVVDAMSDGEACLVDVVADSQAGVACLVLREAQEICGMGIVFISWLSTTSGLGHRLHENRSW
jgi:hypothetical protein